MHDEEKALRKVIRKSEEGNWERRGYDKCLVDYFEDTEVVKGVRLTMILKDRYVDRKEEQYDHSADIILSSYDFIFSHDVAEGIWGKKPVCTNCGRIIQNSDVICTDENCEMSGEKVEVLPKYLHQLQSLVIQKLPLSYLAETL